MKTALALAALIASTAAAPAQARSCKDVENPYPGTRYEGVDLSHITAEGVKCPKARRVAAGAHEKGLARTPDANGYLYYGWNGWAINGNLRPSHDRYVARRRGRVVHWHF